MDFALSAAQRAWQEATVEFGRAELGEDVRGRDERGEFWREGWDRCARFGLLGLPVPEAYGGRGQDLDVTIAAMEGLGATCRDAGLILALNAQLWTVAIPLLQFGTDEQKRRYLPGLCDGSIIGANAASEPDAGSDIFAMQARAVRTESGWTLDGRKTWVTAGPVADLFVAYASIHPEAGALGLGAFLVPSGAPGFRVVRTIPKMGLRTVPMGELAFEDCRLPPDALLGRAGRGAEIFHHSMEWERGAILAGSLGAMRRQLDDCIEHARRREQFGQPIGKFQAVAHRIADMQVRLETSRLLVYKLGWLKSRGEPAELAAAMAKLHVSECSVQNSLDAVRIFGAAGYVVEGEVERDLRDSVGSLIYSGTNDIQRNLIARLLRV